MEDQSTMPFKSSYFSRIDDPFFYSRAPLIHRNSIEEMIDQNDQGYIKEGLESCLKTRQRP